MEQVGKSSLWEEKFRPKKMNDLILPKKYKSFFEKMIKDGEIQNILLAGTAGLGKTTTGLVLANELSSDLLFINASLENSVDVVRDKVKQFAMTSSFSDGKKIVLLDEIDRMVAGQEALKALMEMTEANCRFIFTTNNLSKIIEPILSRCRLIDFSFTKTDTQEIIIQYFKRCQFILEHENIKYDKKVLAEFIKKNYPDFRKITNGLQLASSMFGCIDEQVYSISAESLVENLIVEMKAKKFLNVQKICSTLDPTDFYRTFYLQLHTTLDPKCIPDVILILGEGAYRNAISTDKEIQLMSSVCQLMQAAVWK